MGKSGELQKDYVSLALGEKLSRQQTALNGAADTTLCLFFKSMKQNTPTTYFFIPGNSFKVKALV